MYSDVHAEFFKQLPNAPWSGRAYSVTVTIGTSMLLIGGFSKGQGPHNSVWRSDDTGTTWYELSPFPVRLQSGASLAFDDLDFVIVYGGISEPIGLDNRVWCSRNKGLDWTEIFKTDKWSPRYGHSVAMVHIDRQQLPWTVLAGGYTGKNANDVWLATQVDQGTWSRLTESAPWDARSLFGMTSFSQQTRLILAAGQTIGYVDVWKGVFDSKMMLTWSPVTLAAQFYCRESYLFNFNDNLYVMGRNSAVSNDVWVSLDNGQTWLIVSLSANIADRYGFNMFQVGNELVLAGGITNTDYLNDVFSGTIA